MRTIVLSLAAMLCSAAACAAPWYPVAVRTDGQPQAYTPLDSASKPWRICALLPHGIDKFWWGVSWGLSEEAQRLHIKLGIYEAGGYDHQEVQRSQFVRCRQLGADAIILAAVTRSGLKREIEEAIDNHVVVVDLINGVTDSAVSARVVGDSRGLGALAANYIRSRATRPPVTVLWLPGPSGAEWVSNAERGVREVLQPAVATLIDGGYDVPEPSRQMALIRTMFHTHQPDYVLANSVAAVAAARIVSDRKYQTQVVAWYANEPVVALIEAGLIAAAPSNHPVLQARIGLDLAVRALERKKHPFDVKVLPEMLDSDNIKKFKTEKLFAPSGTWMVRRTLPD